MMQTRTEIYEDQDAGARAIVSIIKEMESDGYAVRQLIRVNPYTAIVVYEISNA
jgi:hypothetical protein